MRKSARDWVNMRRDQETGIESVHAHFRGHAYDPHAHDEILVGATQQGVQQFSCHRTVHTSLPGRAILIEPGAVHDGYASEDFGFTYVMLYLPQQWVARAMHERGHAGLDAFQAVFRQTLTADSRLNRSIHNAFFCLHEDEGKMARDNYLDQLIDQLVAFIHRRQPSGPKGVSSRMRMVSEYLHDHMEQDIGLDELSRLSGMDRFSLTRQFKTAFGQSPHAYLVNLRLRKARSLLARGIMPAVVAAHTGFSDQSHLGRWFQRAYRLSPARYQSLCTNVLDSR